MSAVRWDGLSTGDLIVCPRDGIAERVTFVRPYTTGKVTVRTSRHDHFRPKAEKVERP